MTFQRVPQLLAPTPTVPDPLPEASGLELDLLIGMHFRFLLERVLLEDQSSVSEWDAEQERPPHPQGQLRQATSNHPQ